MSADDHLSSYQFKVERGEGGGTVQALTGEETIGTLNWQETEEESPGTGFVSAIMVHPEHRRRGVATRLMNAMPVRPAYDHGGEEVGNSEEGGAFLRAWEDRRR